MLFILLLLYSRKSRTPYFFTCVSLYPLVILSSLLTLSVNVGRTFWNTFSIALTSVPTSTMFWSYAEILLIMLFVKESMLNLMSITCCSSFAIRSSLLSFHSITFFMSFAISSHFSSMIASATSWILSSSIGVG